VIAGSPDVDQNERQGKMSLENNEKILFRAVYDGCDGLLGESYQTIQLDLLIWIGVHYEILDGSIVLEELYRIGVLFPIWASNWNYQLCRL